MSDCRSMHKRVRFATSTLAEHVATCSNRATCRGMACPFVRSPKYDQVHSQAIRVIRLRHHSSRGDDRCRHRRCDVARGSIQPRVDCGMARSLGNGLGRDVAGCSFGHADDTAVGDTRIARAATSSIPALGTRSPSTVDLASTISIKAPFRHVDASRYAFPFGIQRFPIC
jgi:hypothetical protein